MLFRFGGKAVIKSVVVRRRGLVMSTAEANLLAVSGDRDEQCRWHPVFSPDIVSSDFCFFGNLKKKLRSVAVTDLDSRISLITEIFSDTPQYELILG
jgi:hypothetical protein